MQHHHPGSWYLPWGVPLQKMLAVPMHPGAAAVGFHHQSQAAAAAAAIQVPSNTQHQNYQHQMHPALQHHSSAAAAALHQSLHPAAAAAMFTPLSLRTFINPSANHLSLSPQQTLTSAAVQAAAATSNQPLQSQTQTQIATINLNGNVVPIRSANGGTISSGSMILPVKKVIYYFQYHPVLS